MKEVILNNNYSGIVSDMKQWEKSKIIYISEDEKRIGIYVKIKNYKFPIIATTSNTYNLKLGQNIQINTSNLKIVKKKINGSNDEFILIKGENNFSLYEENIRAKIAYISKSGLNMAVALIVKGIENPVLAFLPKKENQSKGDYIDLSTSLKVVPVTKKDGSVFYFFEPGHCNFILAPPKEQALSPENYFSDYDEAREEHYEELGNSVCEYCGDYHCDCQRDLDDFYENNQD